MWFVEVVKALAWPIVVLFVALTYKSDLREWLPSFLRRRIEVEGFGLKAKVDAAEQQQAAAENPSKEALPANSPLEVDPRLAVKTIETRLQQDLQNIDANKREAVLLRALAHTQLRAGHEFTYNRIFGSQITGLKRLNEVGRVTVSDARTFYQPVGERFPEVYNDYGFDGWLGFLLSSSLVLRSGEVLEISEFGRDFLIYLTEQRLAEGKPW